jgi:hypothetical protein
MDVTLMDGDFGQKELSFMHQYSLSVRTIDIISP